MWTEYWRDFFNQPDGTLDTATYPKIFDTDAGYPLIKNHQIYMTPEDIGETVGEASGAYWAGKRWTKSYQLAMQIEFGDHANVGAAWLLLHYDPDTGSSYSFGMSPSGHASNLHPQSSTVTIGENKIGIYKTDRDGTTVTELITASFTVKPWTTYHATFTMLEGELIVHIGRGNDGPLVITPSNPEDDDEWYIRASRGNDTHEIKVTSTATATVKEVVELLKAAADAAKSPPASPPWDTLTASEDDATLSLTDDAGTGGLSVFLRTVDGGGTDDQILALTSGGPGGTDATKDLSIEDSTYETDQWAHGTIAWGGVFVGAHVEDYTWITFDGGVLWRTEEFGRPVRDAPQVCYDEPRNLLRFSMPTAGGANADQIYVYHLDTGEWTFEDTDTSCLATLLDTQGQKIAAYGQQESTYHLYKIDETATREGSAITSTWTSNWIELTPDPYGRVSVEKLQTFLALAEGNVCEVSVEVADDPDDPTTITQYTYTAGYDSNIPNTIGLGGRFVRVSITNSQSAGAIDLRRILMELLA